MGTVILSATPEVDAQLCELLGLDVQRAEMAWRFQRARGRTLANVEIDGLRALLRAWAAERGRDSGNALLVSSSPAPTQTKRPAAGRRGGGR